MSSRMSLLANFFLHLAVLRCSTASAPPPSTHKPIPKEALPTKSGYLPVNITSGSAIFYTFYEAQNPGNTPLSQVPILLWLQGGPGCSSMIGNFYELGPWLLNQHLSLEPNPDSWNNLFGVLFLDNPIGTGFSIAGSPEEIPTNQFHVAEHLFAAIRKFVALEKSFGSRPIYFTGESYAGKYIPALGYYTLKKNALLRSEDRVNLAGLAIGNGLTDPEIQVATHAVNAYNLGLINEKQKTNLETLQTEAVELARSGNWSAATNARNRVLNTLANMTGLATLYDFRRLIPYQDAWVSEFLSNEEVKRAFGANESVFFQVCSDVVGAKLHEDVMKSVRYMVEFLVRKTKVMLYQGQCDLRDGVVSTVDWMRRMDWDGLREFLEAERKVWRVDGKLAGYVQKWDNFSHVVLTNAGHLVPADQPANSRVMIEDWVLDRGLFGFEKIKDW